MELNAFVAQAIQHIIDGVTTAQEYAKNKGAKVNPSGVPINDNIQGSSLVFVDNNSYKFYSQMIEFDVAVTTADGDKVTVAAGIFGGPLALGSKGEAESSSTAVTRIRFSIPVSLPEQT